MILNDPKSVVKFQPEEDSPVTYHLRVPTVVDRVRYRHAVVAEGGKNWSRLQMLDALEEGLRRILSEPEDKGQLDKLSQALRAYREDVSAVMDEYRQERTEKAHEGDQVEFIQSLVERMNPPAILKEAERIVLDHYPPYAAMLADMEVYREYAGIVAARMFLVGWEGLEAKFKRQRAGVSDEVLAEVPPQHLVAIGAHIQQLMEPELARLKNSVSRSGGRGDPDRSNGIETPQESDPSQTTTGAVSSSESTSSESIH